MAWCHRPIRWRAVTATRAAGCFAVATTSMPGRIGTRGTSGGCVVAFGTTLYTPGEQ